MSSLVKSFVLVLFVLLVTLVLLPPSVYSQTSKSYISSTGRMSTYYILRVDSPNNQITYNNRLPLNFTLEWRWDVLPMRNFSADYAYSIDNNSFVSIVPNNQSSNDRFVSDDNAFVWNPSFFYLLDTSNLSSGYHNVVIKASFYFGKTLFLNDTSTPFSFTVQNPTSLTTPSDTSSPDPTVPEFPLYIIPLIFAVTSIVLLLATARIKFKNQENKLKKVVSSLGWCIFIVWYYLYLRFAPTVKSMIALSINFNTKTEIFTLRYCYSVYSTK